MVDFLNHYDLSKFTEINIREALLYSFVLGLFLFFLVVLLRFRK